MPSFRLLSFLLLLPATVAAHGSGTPFDADVGDYRFEISASTVGVRPGEETEFHFELFHRNADGNLEYARFDTLAVEISDASGTRFTKELPSVPGNVLSLDYAFPESGAYAMKLRYEGAGKTVAEATVSVPVGENAGMLGRFITFLEVGGVVLAAFVAVFMIAQERLRKT